MASGNPESKVTRLHDVEQSVCVLGRGAYGTVHLGHWHGTKVAIKRMHDVLIYDERGGYSELYRRFDMEYQVHRGIHHPHVAQLLGVCPPVPGTSSPGLVLEYLPVTLRQRYTAEPLPSRADEVRIASHISSGLQHLHWLNVLHRDLTTNNVMLTTTGSGPCHAKLTDIGAVALMEAGRSIQRMTLNPGNQVYMAPETQICADVEQKAEYGYEADLYSMGVTVLAMVIRREPPNIFQLAREGRGGDISLVPRDHPLLPYIVQCLNDVPWERPTAAETSRHLTGVLKEVEASSVHQETAQGGGVTADGGRTVELEERIAVMQQEQARSHDKAEAVCQDLEGRLQAATQQCIAAEIKCHQTEGQLLEANRMKEEMSARNATLQKEMSQSRDQADARCQDLERQLQVVNQKCADSEAQRHHIEAQLLEASRTGTMLLSDVAAQQHQDREAKEVLSAICNELVNDLMPVSELQASVHCVRLLMPQIGRLIGCLPKVTKLPN